jgi:Ca-activated chloride channel family protein
MWKCCVLAAGLALALPAVPARAQAQPGEPDQYRISTNVDLVVLDVAVVDSQGRYARGLNRQDFTVLEDGRPQTIALFQSEDVPVAAGVIVDSSGSMAPKRADTVTAALAFLEASHPEDDVFVVNFNENVALGLPAATPFTADPDLLRSALNRMPIGGRTALYDAIAAGLRHIRSSRYHRRFLIVFSDGGDNQSRHTLAHLTRLLQESEVTLYTIGLFDPTDPDRNPRVLKKLARLSGGKAYLPGDMQHVAAVCRNIAADIRSRYILGYTPGQEAAEGQFHRLEVRVHAPGRGRLAARTRSGYRTPRRIAP